MVLCGLFMSNQRALPSSLTSFRVHHRLTVWPLMDKNIHVRMKHFKGGLNAETLQTVGNSVCVCVCVVTATFKHVAVRLSSLLLVIISEYFLMFFLNLLQFYIPDCFICVQAAGQTAHEHSEEKQQITEKKQWPDDTEINFSNFTSHKLQQQQARPSRLQLFSVSSDWSTTVWLSAGSQFPFNFPKQKNLNSLLNNLNLMLVLLSLLFRCLTLSKKSKKSKTVKSKSDRNWNMMPN